MIGWIDNILNLLRGTEKVIPDVSKINSNRLEIDKESLSNSEFDKKIENQNKVDNFDPDNLVEKYETNSKNALKDNVFDPDKLVKSSSEVNNDSYEIVDQKVDIQKYYDDNAKLYREGDNLTPNNIYTINGYDYRTDEEGRIISAEGKLRIKEHEGRKEIKDSMGSIGKGDELPTDDRGHYIGDQFDGSNGLENMMPQDAKLNRGEYKNLEMELRKEVENGKDTSIKVETQYDGYSRRPSNITVTYSVDGEINIRVFRNGGQ